MIYKKGEKQVVTSKNAIPAIESLWMYLW